MCASTYAASCLSMVRKRALTTPRCFVGTPIQQSLGLGLDQWNKPLEATKISCKCSFHLRYGSKLGAKWTHKIKSIETTNVAGLIILNLEEISGQLEKSCKCVLSPTLSNSNIKIIVYFMNPLNNIHTHTDIYIHIYIYIYIHIYICVCVCGCTVYV